MLAEKFLEQNGFTISDYYGDNIGYVRNVTKDSTDIIKVRCFRNTAFIFLVEYEHVGISSSDTNSSVVLNHVDSIEKLEKLLSAFS